MHDSGYGSLDLLGQAIPLVIELKGHGNSAALREFLDVPADGRDEAVTLKRRPKRRIFGTLLEMKSRLSGWRWVLCCGGILVFLAAVIIPGLDDRHSRQRANEAAAVGALRTVAALEIKYAAAHRDEGFACELPRLRPPEQAQDAEYNPLDFLITRTHAGYKFALGNCRADANGVIASYQATAVPAVPGSTGFKAFCTNESGLLWYNAAGSAGDCLTSRRSVE